jgi:polyisoprenoid-binding protein YceI
MPALVGTLLATTFSIVGAQEAPRIDPNHTSAHFAAKHLLISTVQGYVPVKSVAVMLGKDYVPTSVEAQLDLSKIDTHNDRRDNDLRSQRFLAVEQYPDMTFKSTKITPQGAGKFSMDGLLTIRGVTKPVTLDGDVVGSVKDDKGHTHVGYAATTTIDRTQWGVGSTIPAAIVGDSIQITIEAEAIL